MQILYLHANKIASIKEVDKLTQLTGLRKLTLHGNPIETEKVKTILKPSRAIPAL